MLENFPPGQRFLVRLTVILCCAFVGAGIAWICPVFDAFPNPESDAPYDQTQAVRNLQQDNASRKLSRAGIGALGGCTFGIAYLLLRKRRDTKAGL